MPGLKSSDSNLVQEIKEKAVKSLKWSVLADVINRALPALITLVLARILVPGDFGIIAVAMIFVNLAQTFQDFGLGRALIQREQEREIARAANIVFWSNLGLGTLLYLIIFITTPFIANFFHEAKVVNILRVLCLQIIFVALGSTHFALLQRGFQFRKIFFSGLGPNLIPAIISIPLALMGWGVWALVWGSLVGSLSRALILWKVSSWRPQLNFDLLLAKHLFGFGGWVLMESFFAWLIVQGESITLGHFLNVEELGVYRVGSTFVMLIFGTTLNPLLPVIYSSFSRLQSKLSELKQFFLKVAKIVAVFSLPLGVGLFVAAKPISLVIFGNKWIGIEIVIAIIGITQAISWLVGINHSLYRAIGRPDANSKILGISAVFDIPVYILAAPYGLLVFCSARFGLEMIYIALHFLVTNKLFKLPFFYLKNCLKLPFIATLLMGGLTYSLIRIMSPFIGWQGLFKTIIIVILGGMTYIIAFYFLDKTFFKQSIALVKMAINK